MSEIIKVRIADYKVAGAPGILVSCGFGSCVGVSLYDGEARMGGLAHIMLPGGGRDAGPEFYPRYADTAIEMMLAEMEERGCDPGNMVAKLAGGASMFPNLKKADMGIGERNIEAAMEILRNLSIPVIASDTGGDYGRSVEFHAGTGDMSITSIMHGVRVI